MFFAILFGVAPSLLLNYVTPSVNRQVETLADWTRRVHDVRPVDALPPVAVNGPVSGPMSNAMNGAGSAPAR